MNTSPTSDQATLHLVIHGRVQGVFFRDLMQQEALKLGICGWVRNRIDGTVEAVVQGDRTAVNSIVQWSKHGPKQARVERVEVDTITGTYTGFEIL